MCSQCGVRAVRGLVQRPFPVLQRQPYQPEDADRAHTEGSCRLVETRRATVAANGLTHLRIACVKELSCTGTVVLRGVAGRPGHQPPVTLGKASFGSIPAGGNAVLTVKLSSVGLAMLRSHKTLNAQATATASHRGGQKRSRTTSLTLTLEAS